VSHSPYNTAYNTPALSRKGPKHPGAAADATPLAQLKKRLPLRVMTPQQWQCWQRDGYVLIPEAVPPELIGAVVEMLWQFQEMDPDQPETWYQPQRRLYEMTELNGAGMVEVFNHQSLWDVRQHPRMYDIFVDIWDREDLWVAIDRANLNPPNKNARESGKADGFIHFDVDPSQRPLPIAVQGVLSLAPQGGEIGGFQCVPGIFRQIDTWWEQQPQDSNPFKPDTTGFEIVNVDMQAGDLLIFNSLLAHGVRPNRSRDSVRMAQYVSMFPADMDNTALREERIRLWREQSHPQGVAFAGDPRDYERTHYEVATLTPLGRKLLGLDAW